MNLYANWSSFKSNNTSFAEPDWSPVLSWGQRATLSASSSSRLKQQAVNELENVAGGQGLWNKNYFTKERMHHHRVWFSLKFGIIVKFAELKYII